jgi:hypothetical protein
VLAKPWITEHRPLPAEMRKIDPQNMFRVTNKVDYFRMADRPEVL